VPTKTLTPADPAPSPSRPTAPAAAEKTVRAPAQRHVEQVRKFKRALAVYVLSLLVLTPVWVVTQYETSPGWPEHLSSRSRYPGDWDPWIIWVTLLGLVVVAIAGFRAYSSRGEPKRT
jgi:hypothetical protein